MKKRKKKLTISSTNQTILVKYTTYSISVIITTLSEYIVGRGTHQRQTRLILEYCPLSKDRSKLRVGAHTMS